MIYAVKEEQPCKGRIYKCKINNFINSKDEIIYNQRFVLLKRESCPGCEACGWMDEALDEFTKKYPFLIDEYAEHDAKYYLDIEGSPSEYIDECDFILRRIN